MKKIAVLLLTVLLTVAGFSQDDTSGDFKKFKLGFKLDPNLSWMTPRSNDLISDGILARASFGLNADIMFSENYAFGTGFAIMKNGGYLNYLDKETRDNDDTEYIVLRERKYKLNYIEVPLTFKLRTSEIGYMTYWGQFGMGLAFTTAAKAEDNLRFINQLNPVNGVWEASNKDDIREEVIPDISDDIIPIRASLIVAAGVEYSLNGSTSAIFGVTYDNGFTNVLDGKGIERDDSEAPVFESVDGGGLTPKEFDLKTISNHFQLTIGILF